MNKMIKSKRKSIRNNTMEKQATQMNKAEKYTTPKNKTKTHKMQKEQNQAALIATASEKAMEFHSMQAKNYRATARSKNVVNTKTGHGDGCMLDVNKDK